MVVSSVHCGVFDTSIITRLPPQLQRPFAQVLGRFAQVSGNTVAPRGAGYLAKFQIISVSSSQIKLRQGGELRVSWRSSNFANQGNFAKLANNQY